MSKDLNIKLCRPDRTTIYSLNDIIGPKYHEVYNGINTLTFEVPYYITDYTGTQFKNPVIDLIKPFYLLFYKEQYFIIDLPTQSSTETTDKLNVQAYGLGYQLGNKRIRNFSTGTVATPVMNLEDTANAILGKATIRFTPTTITTTGMPFDFNIGDIIIIDGCSVTANNTTATITAIDTNKYMLTCAASSFTSATEIVNVEITNGIDTYINGVTLSGWKVGTVDAGIRLLYRAIEISDSSLLESINNLCEVWDCIAKYDTINRLINFVDYKTDGFFDGLVISQARYMKSIETDKINDLTTKLHVYGVNDLSINAVNPNGQNYITDYTYVKNTDYMSQDMIDNLELYENTLENSQGQFTGYLDNKVSYQANLLTKQNELDFLINEVDNGKTALELKIDIAIANGDSTTALKAQLAIREGLIDDKNAEIAAVESQIAAVDTQILILQTSLDISNFLSSEEVSLLNDLTFESTYVDTNITALGNSTSTLMLLMEEAVKQLALVSTPRFSAKINIVDFLHAENSTYDKDKLKIGNIIKVRHPDLGIYLDVKIVDIEQDFDNFGLNIVVANTKSLKDGFTKGQSLLRSVSSMNGMLSVNANSWSNGGAAGTIVNDYINNAINTTKQTILGGVNNSVQINERGITITDPVEPQYVQRFTAGAWGMSSDGGENFKVGASKGTIYADTIVGELVVAQNGVFDSLVVYNDDNLKVCEIGKYLDGATEKYGIRINSGYLEVTAGGGSGGVVLQDTLYNNVKISSAYGIQVYDDQAVPEERVMIGDLGGGLYGIRLTDMDGNVQMTTDSNGDVLFGGKLSAATGTFSGSIAIGSGSSIFKADTSGIYLGSSTFGSAPFRVDTFGNVTASSVEITGGEITGTDIFNSGTSGEYIKISNGDIQAYTAGGVKDGPSMYASGTINSFSIWDNGTRQGDFWYGNDDGTANKMRLGSNYEPLKIYAGGPSGTENMSITGNNIYFEGNTVNFNGVGSVVGIPLVAKFQ